MIVLGMTKLFTRTFKSISGDRTIICMSSGTRTCIAVSCSRTFMSVSGTRMCMSVSWSLTFMSVSGT